jgi:hypothetical protein
MHRLSSSVLRKASIGRKGPTTIRFKSYSRGDNNSFLATDKSWSQEWKAVGLGPSLPPPGSYMTNILFVQTGFGVDQQ